MKILQLNSSLNSSDSASSTITDALAAQLGGAVSRRDLAAQPLPHLDEVTFTGFSQEPAARGPESAAAVARSDALIDELREADVLLIAAPMYNFGLPSTLKAWFDHVLRAGITFRYTSEGPQGLLGAKRVIIVSSRGGRYAGTDADTHSAHLRQLIGFMGLGEPEFVYAEGMANPDTRAARLAELTGDAAAA